MREAVEYYSKVLAVAGELKAPELLDMPSYGIGIVLVFQGHLARGRQLLDQAIPSLQRTGNHFLHCRARSMRGFAKAMMGDVDDARRDAEQALELGRTINSSGIIAHTNLVLSAVHSYSDHDAEAQRHTDAHTRSAIEATVSGGDAVFEYVSRGIRAWCLAMYERFEDAAEEMERCLALAAKLGDQLVYTDQFTARRADIALGLGRREEARALARKALEISRMMGGIHAEAHAHRAMARIIATDATPDFAGAEARLTRSLELYESGQNVMGMAHAEIDWGGISRLRGDETAARGHYGKAIAIFESKGLEKRVAQVRALMEG
jgi:tetratricopeptide (TPR) repeat protein